MGTSPLVSIIIPVYNEEKYVNFCLSSLMAQTYKNTEIILVNDGSTDKSLEMIKKFNVKILNKKHQGPGRARNYGARYAKGEIFVFLDADMRYNKNYVGLLIKPLIENKPIIGTFSKDEYVANQNNIWSNCWSINSNLPINRHSPLALPDKMNIFRAIRKNEFMLVGGFDSAKGYFDDRTLAEKLKRNAVAAPGAVSYHFNPESLREVFYSARWVGRNSVVFKRNIKNLLRFSILNSLRISIKEIIDGAPIAFILFKITYDFGMFCGIFLSFDKNEK